MVNGLARGVCLFHDPANRRALLVAGDGCGVCDSGGMVCERAWVYHYLQGYPCQLGGETENTRLMLDC